MDKPRKITDGGRHWANYLVFWDRVVLDADGKPTEVGHHQVAVNEYFASAEKAITATEMAMKEFGRQNEIPKGTRITAVLNVQLGVRYWLNKRRELKDGQVVEVEAKEPETHLPLCCPNCGAMMLLDMPGNSIKTVRCEAEECGFAFAFYQDSFGNLIIRAGGFMRKLEKAQSEEWQKIKDALKKE